MIVMAKQNISGKNQINLKINKAQEQSIYARPINNYPVEEKMVSKLINYQKNTIDKINFKIPRKIAIEMTKTTI